MNLDSFLGGKTATVAGATEVATATKTALPDGEEVAGVATGAKTLPRVDREQGYPDSSSESAVDVAPATFTTDITPSGIEVFYQSEPKRLYKVREAIWQAGLRTARQPVQSEWIEVPSVTTVLGILNKPQLVWWGMQRGVEGVVDLFAKGVLATVFDWDVDQEVICLDGQGRATVDQIVDALKEHKLTVNHRLEKASERGVNVHDALEAWASTGAMPRPDEFPESERGYVQGLVKFIEDVNPTPIRQEVMVGSVEHLFAGRFDLVMETSSDREYTSRCYPKRTDKRDLLIHPTVILADLKTSKGVYATHHLQLAAYELAAVECGYPATDAQAVFHVTESGKYELVFSKATPDQFLAIRRAYQALEELGL